MCKSVTANRTESGEGIDHPFYLLPGFSTSTDWRFDMNARLWVFLIGVVVVVSAWYAFVFANGPT